MLLYLLAIVLMVVATVAILMIKELEALPLLERKRRARNTASHKQLYSLRAHGLEAYILLWFIAVLSFSLAAACFMARIQNAVPAALLLVGLMGILWGLLLHIRWRLPIKLAGRCAVALERLASWLGPVLRRLARLVRPLLKTSRDSHRVYEKDDLLHFLHALRNNPEVRIPADELQLAESSLTYADKVISYYMTPRRMVKMIAASEQIGPVLLDELHKTGFSRMPVYKDSEDTIVGTLYIKDLLDVKDDKTVADVMQHKAYYVHEDLTLSHALRAFLKTKCHLFMVVNQFQEIVGIITIEDVIEQIIGQPIIDEFDQYDNLREVAALHAKQDRQQRANQQV